MRNTVLFDVVMLLAALGFAGLIGWVVLDGLRQGKFWVKGGGRVYRARNPIGFWFTVLLNALAFGVFCFGGGAAVYDLALGWAG
jgi:hypothetical protein